MSGRYPIATPPDRQQPCGSPAVTVVVADPHEAFRSVLREVVSRHAALQVVAATENLVGASAAVRRHRAHALVLAAKLFAGGRLTLGPLPAHTAIVVVGMSDARAVADEVVLQGAHAYVIKDEAHAVLADVLLRAAEGREAV